MKISKKISRKIIALSCTSLLLAGPFSLAQAAKLSKNDRPIIRTILITGKTFNKITGANAQSIDQEKAANTGRKTKSNLAHSSGEVRIISGSDRCAKAKYLYPIFVYGQHKKRDTKLPLALVCASSKKAARSLAKTYANSLDIKIDSSKTTPIRSINRQSIQSFNDIF